LSWRDELPADLLQRARGWSKNPESENEIGSALARLLQECRRGDTDKAEWLAEAIDDLILARVADCMEALRDGIARR